MLTKPLMACGHAANGSVNGIPCCVICYGSPEAMRLADTPVLTDRIAMCNICRETTKSSTTLAFFKHQPDEAFDLHYCGCRGWN